MRRAKPRVPRSRRRPGRRALPARARAALLEDMGRQIEAFSFSVSHDLRAPLRAMINYADLARKACAGRVDEVTLGYLEKIASAAYRLEKITHELLRFTRLSKAPPNIAPVGLAPLIAELLVEYPALEAAKTFFQAADVHGQVAANESLLRQALSSLLENAVKFRDPERPLAVRLWTTEEASAVTLFVRDNGIGIEPQHQGRIFMPFERLRPGESGTGTGTGMGLTLCKRSIELMGGHVGFESEPGKGSTFWVELPKA